MAYDTASSELLALVFATDPYAVQVARINPATAALTLLNSSIPACCSPIAFDGAYDDINRKLYAVLQPYAGEPQTRLLTFSGADGSVLADIPISTTLELDHLAYDAPAGDPLGAGLRRCHRRRTPGVDRHRHRGRHAARFRRRQLLQPHGHRRRHRTWRRGPHRAHG